MPCAASTRWSRRELLCAASAAGAWGLSGLARGAGFAFTGEPQQPALIAMTLDLEMSRHYPTWDQLHWDYEKGNLDEATRQYALAAARRVHKRGGVIHFFALGRTLEQENIDWLREIVALGHPIGNHTYDHVNVAATRSEDIQFRFQRSPWLIAGREPREVIAENIRLTNLALKSRLGIEAAGFRTPGGFRGGLGEYPEVRKLIREQGFSWVSSDYPAHPVGEEGQPVTEEVFAGIVAAQRAAQPYVYPCGLVEVPMSPVSDVTVMRAAKWRREDFLEAVRRGVAWAIQTGGVYDFLAHPSCLCVTDPDFQAIDLICELVDRAGERAKIVDLGTIAKSVSGTPAAGRAS
ncbi:MAG: polysaccharide deacetylase family protein [Planctomycetaceae bacterium]|nr:polysaccharide deacetylase family protein [Planctomycetaceae bacterium]